MVNHYLMKQKLTTSTNRENTVSDTETFVWCVVGERGTGKWISFSEVLCYACESPRMSGGENSDKALNVSSQQLFLLRNQLCLDREGRPYRENSERRLEVVAENKILLDWEGQRTGKPSGGKKEDCRKYSFIPHELQEHSITIFQCLLPTCSGLHTPTTLSIYSSYCRITLSLTYLQLTL